MRVVPLSDHPSAMLRDVRQRRAARDAARAQRRRGGWLRSLSPSVQLNEPATLLEGFLTARGYPVTIGRVVALVHPRAQLGRCTRPTVEIGTSVGELPRMLDASPVSVNRSDRAALEQLIIRDHRFHAQHRPPR
jgi:hypothetical protein